MTNVPERCSRSGSRSELTVRLVRNARSRPATAPTKHPPVPPDRFAGAAHPGCPGRGGPGRSGAVGKKPRCPNVVANGEDFFGCSWCRRGKLPYSPSNSRRRFSADVVTRVIREPHGQTIPCSPNRVRKKPKFALSMVEHCAILYCVGDSRATASFVSFGVRISAPVFSSKGGNPHIALSRKFHRGSDQFIEVRSRVSRHGRIDHSFDQSKRPVELTKEDTDPIQQLGRLLREDGRIVLAARLSASKAAAGLNLKRPVRSPRAFLVDASRR